MREPEIPCDAARTVADKNENRIENRCTPPVLDGRARVGRKPSSHIFPVRERRSGYRPVGITIPTKQQGNAISHAPAGWALA